MTPSKICNAVAICSFIFVTPSVIAAGNNTLTFTGSLFDTACTVLVNGGNSSIEIGGTALSDLSSAGQTGAPKLFTVSLTGCPESGEGVPTKVFIKFSGQTETNPAYFKNLLTGTDAAGDIAMLIKDWDGNAIVNNDGNTPIDLPPAGGNLDAIYTASLVSLSNSPSAGNYSAAITYSISYN